MILYSLELVVAAFMSGYTLKAMLVSRERWMEARRKLVRAAALEGIEIPLLPEPSIWFLLWRRALGRDTARGAPGRPASEGMRTSSTAS